MINEGYIKFNCHWDKGAEVDEKFVREINLMRDKLFSLGWIGQYEDGIGYGNISLRHSGGTFVITGSATGGLSNLDSNHYTLVSRYSFSRNTVYCKGPVEASSESLSHASVYEHSPESNAVIHIHSKAMWEKLLHQVPTTSQDVEYGTPAMAEEIARLFGHGQVQQQKIIAMGGHPEGIISFGSTLKEAADILFQHQ